MVNQETVKYDMSTPGPKSQAFADQIGKGRPKGSANKSTKLAKDAIAYAAEQLGGGDRIVAWAREDDQNERVFWGTIYPKLLPLQVTGEIKVDLGGWFDERGE